MTQIGLKTVNLPQITDTLSISTEANKIYIRPHGKRLWLNRMIIY